MAKRNLQDCAGFSLIETMIAAVILGIAFTGTMSMLGTGASIQTEDGLRRQARMILAASLEQDVYNYSNYGPLAIGTRPDVTFFLQTGTVPPTPPVQATLSITVTVGTPMPLIDPDGGADIPLPYKIVTSQIRWPVSGHTETLTLQKSIPEPH